MRKAFGNAALAAVIKESQVLREFRYVLDLCQNRGDLFYMRCNVSPIIRGRGEHKTFHPNPDMEGAPDLMIWIKGGAMVCLEVKRPRGYRLSDAQKRFKERIESVGHVWVVLTSFAELRELLGRYGVTI